MRAENDITRRRSIHGRPPHARVDQVDQISSALPLRALRDESRYLLEVHRGIDRSFTEQSHQDFGSRGFVGQSNLDVAPESVQDRLVNILGTIGCGQDEQRGVACFDPLHLRQHRGNDVSRESVRKPASAPCRWPIQLVDEENARSVLTGLREYLLHVVRGVARILPLHVGSVGKYELDPSLVGQCPRDVRLSGPRWAEEKYARYVHAPFFVGLRVPKDLGELLELRLDFRREHETVPGLRTIPKFVIGPPNRANRLPPNLFGRRVRVRVHQRFFDDVPELQDRRALGDIEHHAGNLARHFIPDARGLQNERAPGAVRRGNCDPRAAEVLEQARVKRVLAHRRHDDPHVALGRRVLIPLRDPSSGHFGPGASALRRLRCWEQALGVLDVKHGRATARRFPPNLLHVFCGLSLRDTHLDESRKHRFRNLPRQKLLAVPGGADEKDSWGRGVAPHVE